MTIPAKGKVTMATKDNATSQTAKSERAPKAGPAPKAEVAPKSEAPKSEMPKPETPKSQAAKPDTAKGGPAGTKPAESPAETVESTREASEEAIAVSRAAMAQGAGLQEEAMRFFSMRMERQMDHVGALMGCRSPVELMEVESRFAVQSFQDYLDETYRLLERAVDVGSGAIGVWPQGRPSA